MYLILQDWLLCFVFISFSLELVSSDRLSWNVGLFTAWKEMGKLLFNVAPPPISLKKKSSRIQWDSRGLRKRYVVNGLNHVLKRYLLPTLVHFFHANCVVKYVGHTPKGIQTHSFTVNVVLRLLVHRRRRSKK